MSTGGRHIPEYQQKVVFYILAMGRPEDANAETSGSGFLVRTDDNEVYLMTCKHVIEGYQRLMVYWRREESEKFDIFELALLRGDGQPHWISFPNDLDIAAYQLELDTYHELEEVPDYAAAENVRSSLTYGDQVLAFGFPALNGHPYTWSIRFPILKSGIIAYPAREDFEGKPHILLDSTLRWGFSGGLVFCHDQNRAWYILGVVTSGCYTTEGSLGELCIIIKWNAVRLAAGKKMNLVYLKK